VLETRTYDMEETLDVHLTPGVVVGVVATIVTSIVGTVTELGRGTSYDINRRFIFKRNLFCIPIDELNGGVLQHLGLALI